MGKYPLKGLGRKDRKTWDKTNPQYQNYDRNVQDFFYYKDIIHQREYDNREDYAALKEQVNAAQDVDTRNSLMINFINNAIGEKNKTAVETIVDEVFGANNPEVREEEKNIIQEEQANTSIIKDPSKKINIWDALKSGFKSGLMNYNEYPTKASDELLRRRNEAKLRVSDEKEKQWQMEDAFAAEQNAQQTSLDRIPTEDDIYKIEGVINRANEVSPVFKNTKLNEKYLNLPDFPTKEDEDSWEGIANEYQGVLNGYVKQGKTEAEAQQLADQYLNRRLQNIVHDKQPFWTQLGNGTLQMMETVVSTGISFGAMGRGLIEAITGNWDYHQGETWFEYLIDAVNNNPWAVAANNLAQYGTINEESVERLIEEGGFRKNPVVASWEADNGGVSNMFDKSLVPNLVGQQGFTIALALSSMGMSEVSEGILALRKAQQLSKLEKAIMTAEEYSAAAARIGKRINAESKIGSAAIAFLSGVPEGHQNGYETKKRILEEGQMYLEDIKQKDLIDSFNASLVANNIDVESEEEYMELLDRYSQYYSKTVEDFHKDKYEDISEQIELSAIRGATINTVWTNFLNGSINSTLKLTVQAPAVRNRLRNSKLEFKAVQGTNNKVTVTPKTQSNFIRRVINDPLVKAVERPFGEGLEEYGQTIGDEFSSSAAKNHIANYVRDTYDFTDTSYEDFEGGLSDFAAAWRGVIKGGTSDEALKAGIYGALGSILGAPAFSRVNYKNPTTGKYDLSRRVDESFGQYVRRITPWSGVLGDYDIHSKEIAQQLADAKEIEEFLNNPKNIEITNSILALTNFEQHITDAINTEDELTARNNVVSKLVKQASMLNRIKGSPVAEAWISRFNALSSMEEGSDIANEAIEEYKKQNSTDNLNDKEIFDTIKSNAQKMQSVIEETSKYLDQAEYIFPNARLETKEAYAYAMVALNDQQERQKSIRAELNNIQIDTGNSEKTDYTEAEKSAIIQFGSRDKAIKGIKKLQEEKSKLEKEISKISKSNDPKVKQQVDIKERKLRGINTELETYKDIDVKEFAEKKGSSVLTTADIVSLTEEQKAEMFKPGRMEKYSEQQKAIINDVLAQGTAQDPNYRQKTIDLARLNTSIKELANNAYEVTQDAAKMDRFVTQQVLHRAIGFYTMEAESLAKIDDYDTFVAQTTEAFNKADRARAAVLQAVLNRRDTDNWNKFKASREYASNLLDYAIKNTRQVETFGIRRDRENLATFGAAVSYLVNEGVDLSDNNAVQKALNERDNDGISLIQKYIEKSNRGLPRNQQILFSSVESIYNDYLHYTFNYDKFKKDEEFAKQKPEPVKNPQAAKPVETKPQQPEEKKETLVKQYKLPEVNKAIQDIREIAIQDKLSKKDMKSLEEIMQSFDEEVDFNTFWNSMLESYSRGKKGSKSIRNTLKKYSQRLKVERRRPVETSSDNTEDQTKSSMITIFDIDAFSGQAYSPVANIYTKYKINEYVSSNKLQANAEVFFAVEPELAKKGSYIDKNNKTVNFTPENIGIMALVKDSNGPISIGKEHYQPIGLIPRANDTYNRGSSLTTIIRNNLIQQALTPTTYTLITSKGKPVSTTLRIVNTASRKTGEPQSFKALLEKETGLTGDELTENFVKRARVKTITSKEGKPNKYLNYEAYEGDEDGVTIVSQDVLNTTNENGVTLEQVLTSGSMDRITGFNFFTERLLKGLRYLATNDKSEFLKNLQEGNLDKAGQNLKSLVSRSIYINNNDIEFKVGKKEDTYSIYLMYKGRPEANIVKDLPIGDFMVDIASDIIINLAMNHNDSIRWQLDFSVAENKPQYLEGIFNSEVLRTSVTSIYPSGTQLVLNGSTLAQNFGENKPVEVPQQEEKKVEKPANSDNAKTQPPGTNVGVYTAPVTVAKLNKKFVKNFVSASKKLKRDESGNYYTNDKGQESVRVTSIIREKKEGSRQISVAAQTVGNLVDKLTKSYMEFGKINPEDFKSLLLSTRFESDMSDIFIKIQNYKGEAWGFLSPGEDGEFKVSGNVNLVLKDGSVRQLPTTGAMDLCFINATQDKMLIVDTKTFTSGELSDEAKAHYQKQLSLYAGFIEENYGIKTDIAILGIPVDYDKTQQYSTDKEGNLLLGESLAKALVKKPTLIPLDRITLKDLTFNFEELPIELQQTVTQILNGVGADISAENPAVKGTPETFSRRDDDPLNNIFKDDKGMKNNPTITESKTKAVSNNTDVQTFMTSFIEGDETVDGISWRDVTIGKSKADKKDIEDLLRSCTSLEDCKNAIRCGNF